MEAFMSVFVNVFFGVAMIYSLLSFAYLYFACGYRYHRLVKPSTYISYKKNRFHEEFEFVCEFCGATISSGNKNCPTCGSSFGKNKEYQAKKRVMNQRYLEYLKDQEQAIEKELDYIKETMKVIQSYKTIRHKYYNFEIGEPPVYEPAYDYEFTCEYCNNTMRGRSTDEKGCIYCGASYASNLELLICEEEDRLEKCHYDQYMELKDLEQKQNIENELRDARVEKKYKKPITFMEKHAKGIAIFMIFALMLISAGITLLILR